MCLLYRLLLPRVHLAGKGTEVNYCRANTPRQCIQTTFVYTNSHGTILEIAKHFMAYCCVRCVRPSVRPTKYSGGQATRSKNLQPPIPLTLLEYSVPSRESVAPHSGVCNAVGLLTREIPGSVPPNVIILRYDTK